MKDQISSHWTRLALMPRTVWSWNAEQAAPISASSRKTVPFAVPVKRHVARILVPSTSARMTLVRRLDLGAPYGRGVFGMKP